MGHVRFLFPLRNGRRSSPATHSLAAKKFMGVQLVEANSHNPTERWLVERVHTMAKAGIDHAEVGILILPRPTHSPQVEQNRSLIAVSSGLLQRMNKDQVEGVLRGGPCSKRRYGHGAASGS